MADISVIIPSNHDLQDLLKVVSSVCKQTIKPAEIVIIDSSIDSKPCFDEVLRICALNGINLIYERRFTAMPGCARNIGFLKSSSALIAFIDVQTIPRSHWLENAIKLLEDKSTHGVWGATSFKAKTLLEEIVRDGFFGGMHRLTLPGTVFKREVFLQVGQFIDWVRAGEDTDWMLRIELLKIPFVLPSTPQIDYVGLINLNFQKLLKKWQRNYTASSSLPHFSSQRLLIWLILYPLIVLIAFNWNYFIADWRMDSPFYIGHVTKFAAIFPIVVYFALRGIVLPLRRGVDIWQLLPLRFIAITLVCFIADAMKIFAFSMPKRKLLLTKYDLDN